MQSGELLPGPGPSLGSKPADGRGGWRAARFFLGNPEEIMARPYHLVRG
jgi:hypothetical protein